MEVDAQFSPRYGYFGCVWKSIANIRRAYENVRAVYSKEK